MPRLLKRYGVGSQAKIMFAVGEKPLALCTRVIKPGDGNSYVGRIEVMLQTGPDAGKPLVVATAIAVPVAQIEKVHNGTSHCRINPNYEWTTSLEGRAAL